MSSKSVWVAIRIHRPYTRMRSCMVNRPNLAARSWWDANSVQHPYIAAVEIEEKKSKSIFFYSRAASPYACSAWLIYSKVPRRRCKLTGAALVKERAVAVCLRIYANEFRVKPVAYFAYGFGSRWLRLRDYAWKTLKKNTGLVLVHLGIEYSCVWKRKRKE